MLVRIAALVAVDAPPVSYLHNLEVAGEVGVDEEQVRGVLTAIAPIVGTARVASAGSKMVHALGLESEPAELEAEEETGEEGPLHARRSTMAATKTRTPPIRTSPSSSH